MINIIPYHIEQYSQDQTSKEYSYSKLNALKLEHIILGSLSSSLKDELLHLLVLDEFRVWSLHNTIPLDWRTTLFLLHYLRDKMILPSHELALQLVAISASQWTYFDKTLRRKIYIYDTNIKDNLIYAEKSQDPKLNRKIYLINNMHDLNEPTIFSFNNSKDSYTNVINY